VEINPRDSLFFTKSNDKGHAEIKFSLVKKRLNFCPRRISTNIEEYNDTRDIRD